MTATPTRTALAWEYSPAPEATDHIRLRDRYELFVGGAWRPPESGVYEPTINPATEEPLAEIAQAARRRRRRRRRGRPRRAAALAALPALERGKYVFRIARLIQERARELAIVESLDGGKPIRESRDVDMPLAAAHFFYYAGWADKLAYGLARPRRRADGRRRPDRPVELPAADGRLEARPRARLRQHRGAQARRDHAADRAAAGRDLPGGRAARRRREHPARRRLDRRRARPPPGHRQDRLHRLDRRRQGHPGRHRGPRHRPHARARRQVGEHRVRRRRDRPGGRGHRQRHLLQPGPRVLRRLAAAAAGERRRGGHREAVAAHGPAARRRPARQEHRRRRDQLGRAAAADRGAGRRRRARGRDAAHDRLHAARARLLVPADAVHRRRARPPDRRRGDLRPGRLRADVPHTGGGDREGQRQRLRPRRRRVDRQGLARAGRCARA